METIERIGAILAGRRWCDLVTERYGGVGDLYKGAWKGPVLVLTHRPESDTSATFVSDPIEDAVAAARGTRLYSGRRVQLERTAVHAAAQLTDLRLRPAPAATGPGS